MADNLTKLQLWLHREDDENWWVSAGGIGVPRNLPKAKVELADDARPVLGPVQVSVLLPRWLAEDRNFLQPADEKQGSLL